MVNTPEQGFFLTEMIHDDGKQSVITARQDAESSEEEIRMPFLPTQTLNTRPVSGDSSPSGQQEQAPSEKILLPMRTESTSKESSA